MSAPSRGEAEALDLLLKIVASGSTSKLYRELVVNQQNCILGRWLLLPATVRSTARSALYGIPARGATVEELEAGIDRRHRRRHCQRRDRDAELERAKRVYIADIRLRERQPVDACAALRLRPRRRPDHRADRELAGRHPQGDARCKSQAVAAKYFDPKASVTGYLLPKPRKEAPSRPGRTAHEPFRTGREAGKACCAHLGLPRPATSQALFWHSSAASSRLLACCNIRSRCGVLRHGSNPAKRRAAEIAKLKLEKKKMDIKKVKSPGGITAWLVEEHSVPLIAMRFAFEGGSAQDPVGKEGVAQFPDRDAR